MQSGDLYKLKWVDSGQNYTQCMAIYIDKAIIQIIHNFSLR